MYCSLYAWGMTRASMPCHGAYLGLRNSKRRLVAWMAVVVYLATAAAARARLLFVLYLTLYDLAFALYFTTDISCK